MFGSFLAKLTGAIEILAGLMLISGRFSFLGSLTLLPVTVSIAAFHLAHDNPGNGIWVATTLLHVAVLFYQREKLAVLLA